MKNKFQRCKFLIPAVSLSLIALSVAVSAAATITVTSGNDSGPGTLRQAILSAIPGDTINFSANISTIALTSDTLSIAKDLRISGPGANLLTIQRSAVAGNFRIFTILDGNVTISGLTIAFGRAFGDYPANAGGGIFNDSRGTVMITGCAIAGHSAELVGGGVFNLGFVLELINSTVSGNFGEGAGGIYNDGDTMIVTNCTISGNSAGSHGGGGIGNDGTVDVTNSTISNNTSAEAHPVGGGVSNFGTATLRNTIIAKNTASANPADFSGQLTSQGFNLIGNTNGATITGDTTGNQLNVDPKLGPLQNNGGPTQTQALQASSPAIDRGNSTSAYIDQRGLARPVDSPAIVNASGGDGSDIGAYEVQGDQLPGCGINTVVTNNNDSGVGSLRNAIGSVCPGETVTFASNVRGVITLTSGQLSLEKNLTVNGPGADLLTVSGNHRQRIFNISGGVNAGIGGLTLSDGLASGRNGGHGGAILNPGRLTVNACAFVGNSVATSAAGSGHGGAIENSKDLFLYYCTFNNNSAQGGGAIYNDSEGRLTVGACTFTKNFVVFNGGGGGGAILHRGGLLDVSDTTIADNTADGAGGGVYTSDVPSTSSHFSNTIIALNHAPTSRDTYGAYTSLGFNLVGASDSGNGFTMSSDHSGTVTSPLDPKLLPLANNGGTVQTMALQADSPAIDQGLSMSSTDQRGFPRPVDYPGIPGAAGGNSSDIGAFEISSLSLTAASSRKNHGGVLFDINLPLSGEPGVECRTGGAGGNHTLVFRFSNNVVNGNASVTSGAGSVQGSPVFAANTMTVNLGGVADLQKITVTLNNVTDNLAHVLPSTAVSANILLGDTSASKSVNATDISQTKLRAGQTLDGNNFRSDVTVSGTINASDISQVKVNSGHALP